jgi:hypothetical protein
MKLFMGILSVITSLLGVSCSKNTIHVEFINAKDSSVIGVSDMRPEQLPDSFAINTTLDIKNNKWSVVAADPIEKTKFIQTGKLRVSLLPIANMPPGDILFSLATISDDIGVAAGSALPNEKIFAIAEDDWRQREFVSQDFTSEIESEIKGIQNIYQNERSGLGFKKVHVRKQIPNPFGSHQIDLSDLKKLFPSCGKFEAVGFQKTRGTIPNSFAWKLDSKLVLWGVTDDQNIIVRLCVFGVPESENIKHVSEAFSSLNSNEKLTFVDWCVAATIASDVQAFENYFQK